MSEPKVNAIIDNLTDDLAAVRPLGHPVLRFIPWVCLALIYTLITVFVIGVRDDFLVSLTDPIYLAEVLMMFFIGISAGFASFLMCVPDMRGESWVPYIPLTLLAAFIFWCSGRVLAEGLHLHGIHWDHCFVDGTAMGFIPSALLCYFTLKGTTTRPLLMAAMNVLAVTGIAYAGLRITCPVDTVGHGTLYHVFPFAVFGALFGSLSRLIYKW